MVFVATYFLRGRGVSASKEMARLWFEKGAEQGDPDAQYNLGLLYQAGGAVDKDPREAAALFQLAVEQGHVRAHLSLGACYLDGVGVERDLPRALQLFAVPAARGEAEAQYNLAVLYHRGHGTARDAAQVRAIVEPERREQERPRRETALVETQEALTRRDFASQRRREVRVVEARDDRAV